MSVIFIFEYGFSKGSILVDYNVELTDLGKRVDTGEIRRLFHESLLTASSPNATSEATETLVETDFGLEELAVSSEDPNALRRLGNFVLDPQFTEFSGKKKSHNLKVHSRG